MSRKSAWLACAAIVLGIWPLSVAAQQQAPTMAVVELFTSQGCSSCPPADALLKKFSERSDVVALSLSVDYWDYIGWKDTLASPRFTERQHGYAKVRGDHKVYTPQMVVNGMAHTVGSNETEIDYLIEKTRRKLADAQIPLKVSDDQGTVVIETGAPGNRELASSGTIWMATVQNQVEVAITRGENKGLKTNYYNVVKDLTPVGPWRSDEPTTLRVDDKTVSRVGADRCAVLLQQGMTGPIVAAAWLPSK